MARAATAFTRDLKKLREEIKGHQEELSGVHREAAAHNRAIAQAEARQQDRRSAEQTSRAAVAPASQGGLVWSGVRSGFRHQGSPIHAGWPAGRQQPTVGLRGRLLRGIRFWGGQK